MSDIVNYTKDKFLGGKIKILQPKNGFRTSLDSIFLAASINLKKNNSILELGCGVGTILCCLMKREKNIEVYGVEIQKSISEIAKKNLKENNFNGRILNSDIKKLPKEISNRCFDQIIFNPPYLCNNVFFDTKNYSKQISIKENHITLKDWIEIALKRCVDGGEISFIHRTERLGEILEAFSSKAGYIRILPIFSKKNKNSGRIIIKAKKGSKSNLIILPPLIVHKFKKKNNNEFTKKVKKILFNGEII